MWRQFGSVVRWARTYMLSDYLHGTRVLDLSTLDSLLAWQALALSGAWRLSWAPVRVEVT